MSRLLWLIEWPNIPLFSLFVGVALFAFLLGQSSARRHARKSQPPAEVDALLVTEAHTEITKLARLGYTREEIERAVQLALRFGSVQFAQQHESHDQ